MVDLSGSASRDRARERLLLGNATVALVLAALVAVTLHELAHAAAGALRGFTPTLYANAVDYAPAPDTTTRIVTAAAGPLLSLVLGAVVLATTRHVGRGFGRLFALWLGLLGLQNFAGYLFIAPFARAGDTGQVMELLGAPIAAYVLAFLVGAALTLLNSRLLAGQVLRYARDDDELRRLVILPWLVGTGIVVVLTVADLARAGFAAGTVPIVVAGAVSTAIFAPMFTIFHRRIARPAYEELALTRPVVPLVVTAVLAVLIFVVIAPGLRLG